MRAAAPTPAPPPARAACAAFAPPVLLQLCEPHHVVLLLCRVVF